MNPRGLITLALVALAVAGCVSPAPLVDPLEPLPTLGAYMPDEIDRTARDLAAVILAGEDESVEAQIGELVLLDDERAQRDESPSGVLPYALDARNATIPDLRIRRMADEAMLDRDDLDPGLRKRLEQAVDDDPLHLARRRIRDRWILRYGRAANSLMETVGRSSINVTLLPFRLAQSVIGIALAEHMEGELSTPERQALAHWKRFVEQHPSAPEAAELLARIRETQLRWIENQRERLVDLSRSSLEVDRPLLATVYADRALRISPEDRTATSLRNEAHRRTLAWEAQRRRSLEMSPEALLDLGRQRALATALLAPGEAAERRAAELAREILADPDGNALRGEAEYVLALDALEGGVSGEFWDRIEALAEQDDEATPIARYARTEWADPARNPYPAFLRAIGKARDDRARGTLLGPLKDGARDRRLPRWLEWMVEIPAVVGVVAGLPSRLLQAPFQKTDLGEAAIHARASLERWPAGPHAVEIRRWLVGYEKDRGNMVGALSLLRNTPGATPAEIDTLRSFAATQAYNTSLKEKRRDVRIRLLMDVARRFRGTEGGQLAGEAVREEVRNVTAQNIRISRGFLLENPRVAGPDGLALRPELLDDEPLNGELHDLGVVLLGERVLEIALVDGRKSDPPELKRKRVSTERLSRLVAQLEEATLHTLRTDRDAEVEHDADRDLFLERARLGVTGNPDVRAHAESHYAFLGMRERYGLVRSRESILPVQLVLQGNFEDFGLGAFPRIRMPKGTPDAFLYEER